MKKITLFLFLGIMTLLHVQSCCTAKYCSDYIEVIRFKGIESRLEGGVFLKFYTRGTNFSKPIDSQVYELSSGGRDDEASIYVNDRELFLQDFEVVMLPQNLTYRITETTFKKETCNTCVLAPNNDFYHRLHSYKLDGKLNSDLGYILIEQK
ncbi:MAG: hypothetical protein MUE53_06300 [Chitinophagales bacterium]|jgi:hypothetical protein|nr:hypothetical protein [Chitinophagales bacterium]